MTRTKSRRGPSHRMRRPDSGRSADPGRPAPAGAAQLAAAPRISRTVLTIAGMDPSGGAGVSADLKTIAAYRHHGAAVITSLTAQNTQGVQAIYDLPMEFVAQQIDSVVSDVEIHAVKIGMLGTARTASLVASLIDSLSLSCVVLDPVLRSSTGTPLLEKDGIAVLRDSLIPQADVITPNMEEAAVLSGSRVTNLDSMKDAARILHRMGARNVVVTGGHMGARAIDVLFDGRTTGVFDASKVVSGNTHGIGCTFSTALACGLARGLELPDAIDGAKRFVSRAVRGATKIGKGAGPLNHLVTPF